MLLGEEVPFFQGSGYFEPASFPPALTVVAASGLPGVWVCPGPVEGFPEDRSVLFSGPYDCYESGFSRSARPVRISNLDFGCGLSIVSGSKFVCGLGGRQPCPLASQMCLGVAGAAGSELGVGAGCACKIL